MSTAGRAGKKRCAALFRAMLTIREFEEQVRFLFLEGKMPGTVHQYIGMEACAAGVCAALQEQDVIASTHRPNGHALARGLEPRDIVAEMYGKKDGTCGGKGGAMHIGDLSRGMLPAIAIVGGNLPIVTGMALAFKMRGEKRVAVAFFGDGAANEGAFHEALNMAAVYQVPAVFVCENNQYAASTSVKLAFRIEHIADRAAAYGMRGDIADGMDVLEVYRHASEAVERARSGKGPTLLELKTFRFCGHSRRDPCNYMTEQEKQEWKQRDPLERFPRLLLEEGLLGEGELEEIRGQVRRRIAEAIEQGRQGPDPDPEELYRGLYVSMEVPR
ncbi:MAG: thiamine pyrophosphate-dependent dehydrogenase E1 component subunit alpha [Spirochaetota bacterium]